MLPTDIDRICHDRGWTRARLIHEMRSAAGGMGERLPADDSLRRMLREWTSGRRRVSPLYADVLTAALGAPLVNEGDSSGDEPQECGDLAERLTASSAIDAGLVAVLRSQTQALRQVDRRLGAAHTLTQTQAHVQHMAELLRHSTAGPHRQLLAVAVAEAASLAGWQALDLGRTEKSWSLYEVAKSAARESEDPALIAHSTAEQGYALIDLGRPADAVSQMRYARERAAGRVPGVALAWLCAAEAEALAVTGGKTPTLGALDAAEKSLSADSGDDLPFLSLDARHLSRWRGHCLAQIGSAEAVDQLENALESHDATFVRAASGLHTDLAMAYARRGELVGARAHADRAQRLAGATASVRQRRRLTDLRRALQS